ncbi:hypothetical protein BJV78DRAFT_1332595 [Lactifluus subvellereus]|nr:hypothetical protein BJV78DRAFT_1332595 [Lactifluus subvellereus]
MYLKIAEEEMTKRWQKDAEGILIFTGSFFATVAALLAVTVVDLKQNPQDTSAFHLEHIYKLQVLADPNILVHTFHSAQPPPFSPSNYAIWMDSLWFLNLAISLTHAVLAALLQQWARR